MARYDVNLSGFDELTNKMSQLGEKSETVVNQYFANEGYQRVAQRAQGLIHASGRTFKGHTTSAAAASYSSVFGKETSNLALTVKSQGKYRYLYFPDDGSNTKKHAGNQHFMLHGAEQSLPEVTQELLKRIVQEF